MSHTSKTLITQLLTKLSILNTTSMLQQIISIVQPVRNDIYALLSWMLTVILNMSIQCIQKWIEVTILFHCRRDKVPGNTFSPGNSTPTKGIMESVTIMTITINIGHHLDIHPLEILSNIPATITLTLSTPKEAHHRVGRTGIHQALIVTISLVLIDMNLIMIGDDSLLTY